ncbi:MAG: HIT family protein [Desulfobacterales bacterium]|nr:HIT family protein [Desulfobacterales bacterium]
MEDCLFCKIIKGEIPSFKVYEDDNVLAFGDINPISQGHTLVIPRNHAENLWDIDEQDLIAVHKASKKIIDAMKESLDTIGVACVQLNGRGVNQVVMHYHLHLVPRLSGEPELPMSEWEIRQGDAEVVAEAAKKIAAAIK